MLPAAAGGRDSTRLFSEYDERSEELGGALSAGATVFANYLYMVLNSITLYTNNYSVATEALTNSSCPFY